MKRTIFFLGMVLLSFSFKPLKAQTTSSGFYIGARYLPTISDFKMKQVNGDFYKTSTVLGYGIGGLIGVNLSDHIGLQGEVLYSALAQNYVDATNTERRIDLNYINIPLMVVLNTNSSSVVNLNVTAGPQLGILVGSEFDATGGMAGDTVTAVFAAKSGDFGIAYGAGIDFNVLPNFSIDLGYRGVIGLVDISDQSKTLTTDQYYILDRSHLMTYAAYVGVKLKF
ncbi:MAG: porin family protein [Chitinophagales bacterium]